MSTYETSHKARTFDEVVGMLARKLKFSEWPLKEGEFVPGFSPEEQRSGILAGYQLERKKLVPPIISRVTRRYLYRKVDSRLGLDLTVIVGHASARDTAEGLIQLIAASQMRSEPRVDFQTVGDVAVYRQSDSDQSLAFLRNNIGINLERFGSAEGQLPITELAQQIDAQIKETPTSETLTDQRRVPKIQVFQAKTTNLQAGERADLTIEVQDSFPPQDWLFHAVNGSYNEDPKSDTWYFRAGHEKGSAEVTLTVVNNLNLMTTARATLTIE